jgi:hypothetical protein
VSALRVLYRVLSCFAFYTRFVSHPETAAAFEKEAPLFLPAVRSEAGSSLASGAPGGLFLSYLDGCSSGVGSSRLWGRFRVVSPAEKGESFVTSAEKRQSFGCSENSGSIRPEKGEMSHVL